MVSVECRCRRCSRKFVVDVPEAVENRLTGEPYLHPGGEAGSGGTFICPNGHKLDENCVTGSADDPASERCGRPPSRGTWTPDPVTTGEA